MSAGVRSRCARSGLWILGAVAALVVLFPGLALGCPGCIEGTSPGQVRGFLWGMGIMTAVPILVILGIGGGIVQAKRRALQEFPDGCVEEETGGSNPNRKQRP